MSFLMLVGAPVAGGGAPPAPTGPDFLFVDGAFGGWYQDTPLSKLKQLSDGSGDVASASDPVGFWDSWNASPSALNQMTSGNKPEYDGESVLFDAQAVRANLANYDTSTAASPQNQHFVYAARIVPKVNGNLRVGRWRTESEIASDNEPFYGFKLAAGGAITGYCQRNGRTAAQTWSIDTAVTVALIGNGDFGDTNIYVNSPSNVLSLFTSTRLSLIPFGVAASSGAFQVEKLVLMQGRTSAVGAGEITDLFTWLNTEP